MPPAAQDRCEEALRTGPAGVLRLSPDAAAARFASRRPHRDAPDLAGADRLRPPGPRAYRSSPECTTRNHGGGAVGSRRWPRILATTGGSERKARITIAAKQRGHFRASRKKTRLSNCAQDRGVRPTGASPRADRPTRRCCRLRRARPQGWSAPGPARPGSEAARATTRGPGRSSQSSRELLRLDFIPQVEIPDEEGWALRQLVSHQRFLGKQRVTLCNRIRSLLNVRLCHCPFAELFGAAGRRWLKSQPFTEKEQTIFETTLHQAPDDHPPA